MQLATAFAYAGSLTFNTLTDSIPLPDGGTFKFQPPTGYELPPDGYVSALEYYSPPSLEPDSIELAVSPRSDRIQLITPFDKWHGKDELEGTILIKVKGKCSKCGPGSADGSCRQGADLSFGLRAATDHILPAGPGYKNRGHPGNISPNCLIGATNAQNVSPPSCPRRWWGPLAAAHRPPPRSASRTRLSTPRPESRAQSRTRPRKPASQIKGCRAGADC